MGNVLLDWIDGPISRMYNQSSVFGGGIDWLADILIQYNVAVWAVMKSENIYFVTFATLFSFVEFGTCIFDYG